MGVGYGPRHDYVAPLPHAAGSADGGSVCRDFGEPLDRVRTSIEAEYAQRVVAAEDRPRLDYLFDVDSSAAATANITGRERLTKLNEALDSFGLTRSKNQRWFHRQMSQAVIRKIFKDDFAENIDFLREQFQVDDFKSEVMIITPRRWGKTYSVAMFVVACAYAIEGLDQAIFSTGRRASKKLLDLIYQFLCKLPGMKESIIRKNVETIHIQGPGGPDDVRKISSYPSKVRFTLLHCCCPQPSPASSPASQAESMRRCFFCRRWMPCGRVQFPTPTFLAAAAARCPSRRPLSHRAS